MNKHTPGPWFLGESERGRHFRAVDAKEPGALASVVWLMEDDDIDGVSSPRCEANAHLIAAAPGLLEALEALADSAPSACCVDFHHKPGDYHDADESCPALDRYEAACLSARAAIARARGEA